MHHCASVSGCAPCPKVDARSTALERKPSWGFIDTPMVVVQNLGVGKDVTVDVMHALESGG
jgi:hypothetical protein